MNKSVLALLAAAVFIFSSCRKVVGEGPVATETRPAGNFTGISSGMSGKVIVTIGPAFKIEVRAQQNVLNVLKTNVVNGILEIDFKENVHIKTHQEVIAFVTLPTIDRLRLSGSGNMDVQGGLVTNSLKLDISGSGDIIVQDATVTDKINARVSGSGSMKLLNGSAKNEDLAISGSGSMDLSGIAAEKAVAQLSGSGDIRVDLSQTLDAHIAGSGSVYYRGSPVVSTHISGSGKVVPF